MQVPYHLPTMISYADIDRSYKCIPTNAGAISPTNYDLLPAQEELQKIKNFFLKPQIS